MRKLLASRPSPAMAVAFVALLAALSGTAIALPGTNSVDSGDIVNGQVKAKDIGKNAVNGKKVKNGSLGSADVKNGSLTGTDIKDNSLTGSDINESTLGQVPSANTANSANSANTPSSVRLNRGRTSSWSIFDCIVAIVLTGTVLSIAHTCCLSAGINASGSPFARMSNSCSIWIRPDGK